MSKDITVFLTPSWRSVTPWVTGATGAVALTLGVLSVLLGAAAVDPSVRMVGALSFDPTGWSPSDVWRTLTCHLVHFSPSHLGLNVATLGVLGTLSELRSRKALAWALGLSALAIPAALVVTHAPFSEYRGLSGLASAVYMLLCVQLVNEAWADRRVIGFLLPAAAAIGFTAKVWVELRSGQAVFVDSAGAGFHPVPLAHAVAGAIGLGVGVVAWRGEG
jgi:rhomboid family GlyGly-CTERM serine protease